MPFAGRTPDEAYAPEVDAAERHGLPHALLDLEALLDGHLTRALRWLPRHLDASPLVYRGWMLRPEAYDALHAALIERGARLLTDPSAYRFTHLLPSWYDALRDDTPRSTWIPGDTPSDVNHAHVDAALDTFGGSPLIVKDYVKSRKHEWSQACFIPDASDRPSARHVIDTFLARQGRDLVGGLVLREFERFAALSAHSKSGMPLTREHRLFVLDGKVVLSSEYWEEGEYHGETVPIHAFEALAARVPSRFFTMDVAKREDGAWRVVELGDGQVAGLPERANVDALFAALARLT
ncbi:uncharacterized protein DUF4343 [Deinococcus yavapaiensis KR-236]|uniref:Uncharacterized protein DUF4343 n=2 Tax=Deinococcus TaxID=1298 RepID=A0A318SGU3_9DEIO|nr:uncharacterized protein DUF4343 [Deinococcus yavapaiensis KR-236]